MSKKIDEITHLTRQHKTLRSHLIMSLVILGDILEIEGDYRSFAIDGMRAMYSRIEAFLEGYE